MPIYYCVEWKIEQTRFLNFEKRFKNNDFNGNGYGNDNLAFLAQNGTGTKELLYFLLLYQVNLELEVEY